MLQRLLSPIVEVRKEESWTAFLMFAYSCLAMTAYNVIKPLTRSKFISNLGADNLPYVLLGAGLIIVVLLAGYAWVVARLPRRWGLPITQAGMAAMLVVFWFLFQTNATWVSVAFYVAGLIERHLGFGRVLCCRIDSRRSPDKPVLDARQRRLRPEAGEAVVRLH